MTEFHEYGIVCSFASEPPQRIYALIETCLSQVTRGIYVILRIEDACEFRIETLTEISNFAQELSQRKCHVSSEFEFSKVRNHHLTPLFSTNILYSSEAYDPFAHLPSLTSPIVFIDSSLPVPEAFSACNCATFPRTVSASSATRQTDKPWKTHEHVVIGGSFDRLHIGHKVLLGACVYSTSNTLHVGVTCDEMLQRKKFREFLQSYEHRCQGVVDYCALVNPNVRVVCYELRDMFGPSLRPEINAIVVSEETRQGAAAVNSRRQELGHSVLEVIVLPTVDTETDKISSSAIRKYLSASAYLQNHWRELLRLLQRSDDRGWGEKMRERYSEFQRHYHTLEHIRSMLEWFDQYRDLVREQTEVLLAIWFHDVVYDPTRKDNEVQSVEVLREFCSEMELSSDLFSAVEALILQTVSHWPSAECGRDVRLFLDFDLAILAADWSSYCHYARNVREEYRHYSDAEFIAGRLAVLKAFDQRETVFFDEAMRDRLEKVAKKNLSLEIESLEKSDLSYLAARGTFL